jgi:elongation factor G
MMAPTWLIECEIEPRFRRDRERLCDALARMAFEQMPFAYSQDHRTGKVILRVSDDRYLDLIVHRLTHGHRLELSIGAREVAYRETLARSTEIDHTHRQQIGPTGQFARVKLWLEPNHRGAGNEFASAIVGGVVPEAFIPGVERGVESAWRSGVRMGLPMVDTKVTLFDGAYHETDSSALAFELAASAAMREGTASADVRLLEPIMHLEVSSPSEFVGSVIGDLNRRRGQVSSQETRGSATVIRADVPLANLLGYSYDLSARTNGLGRYVMGFRTYAFLPSRPDPDDFRPARGMRA